MHIQLAMLMSDWLIYLLFVIAIVAVFYLRRFPYMRDPWRRVLAHRLGMVALVILCFYAIIGLLDSVHFRISYHGRAHQVSQVKSMLDLIVYPLGDNSEKTYSAPFSSYLYNKSLLTMPDGREVRNYQKLKHVKTEHQYGSKAWDIILRVIFGVVFALIILAVIFTLWLWWLARRHQCALRYLFKKIIAGETILAWRECMGTFAIIVMFISVVTMLTYQYHVLGTDKIGHDVFYESLKSIRTGLLIGTLTTLFMLPFALCLGISAGYFGKWVDDIIQYLYTTLSSIPGVLLISASILVLQVYIASHPKLFPTLVQRADARLLSLCIILGITSWASLCRLLRGETLKLREQEFIQAARALGVGRVKIMLRHLLPNVLHIVLITIVLDFSGLVLAEAVLSYVGVGVDPTTMSWGNMINSSRLELAREPVVWWPLMSALIFMFVLVLAANVFSDAVRDALDPRLRVQGRE